MSQSLKTIHSFGSVSIKKNLQFKLGSTVAAEAFSTPAPTVVADADATLTVSQLRSGIVVQTPTAARTLTLPTAVLVKAFLKAVGDTAEFSVINEGADTFHVTVAAGAGGSIVGSAEVRDKVSSTTTAASGTSRFRIRATNVTTGTEAYIVYRLA